MNCSEIIKQFSSTGNSFGRLPEDQSAVDSSEVHRDEGRGCPHHHHRQLPRHQGAGPRGQDSATHRQQLQVSSPLISASTLGCVQIPTEG